MPKAFKSAYICQQCNYQTSNWVGQCPNCGEWNTMVETSVSTAKSPSNRGLSSFKSGAILMPNAPIKLSQITAKSTGRILSGIKEFDRVLGGGFLPGQVILLAGEPGIGKSTLLTQIAKSLDNKKILYVCGEESPVQIKVRTQRMGISQDNMLLLQEMDADSITLAMETEPELGLVIVDSIQTLSTSELMGQAGSVGQVRGAAQKLTESAKKTGIPLILVGHVTKEGTVAGPKVLEHIVDTVLYLEGDTQHMYRILKTTKNRFGAVSEVGIFEMTDAGMREISNPSELFISNTQKDAPGSCITVSMEGYRPLLFEIQALTVKTNFGYPKRTTSGYNVNRLQVLIATLEKKCGVDLSSYDVYLNVAGGFKLSEYACDLAVCLAIVSSVKNAPLKGNCAAFGECGLLGEVRPVSYQDKRAKEAEKLGYTHVVSPTKAKTLQQAIKLAFDQEKYYGSKKQSNNE